MVASYINNNLGENHSIATGAAFLALSGAIVTIGGLHCRTSGSLWSAITEVLIQNYMWHALAQILGRICLCRFKKKKITFATVLRFNSASRQRISKVESSEMDL